MKTLSLTVTILALAVAPGLASPATLSLPQPVVTTSSLASSVQKPSLILNSRAIELLSGGKVFARLTPVSGNTRVSSDKFVVKDGFATLSGHVVITISQGGQQVVRLTPEEARIPAVLGNSGFMAEGNISHHRSR